MKKHLPTATALCRFPLPTFPPHLPTLFPKLCVAVSEDEVVALKRAVEARTREIRDSKLGVGPNILLCEAIAHSAAQLLESYATFSNEDRAIIVGGVYYFLDKEDYLPDTVPLVGFDDDRGVMNHVIERVGREDLLILTEE
jgi:hypothetical protein